MMDGDMIFRIAFAPAAGIIWARYLSWPVVFIVVTLLVINKFKPIIALQAYLPFAWWAITIIGLSVLVSILLGFVTVPKNDSALRLMMYFTALWSLPTLIPCFIALFFKPPIN